MNIDELIEQLKQLSISQEDALQTQREVGILIAKKSVAAEREACAKLCEEAIKSIFEFSDEIVKETALNVCTNLAKGIRARGNE